MQCLQKWHFHIENLLETATVHSFDSNHRSPANEQSNILLGTIEHSIANIDKLMEYEFECMVVQDSQLELQANTFDQLAKIRATHKIYVTGENIMVGSDFVDFKTFANLVCLNSSVFHSGATDTCVRSPQIL